MVKRNPQGIVYHPQSTPESRKEWREAIIAVLEREMKSGESQIDRRKITKAVREVSRLAKKESDEALGIPMNEIRIPCRFMLGGIWVDVEIVEDLTHKDNAFGQANFNDSRIRIQPNVLGTPRAVQDIERTFFHELTHFLFHMAGEYEYRDDEKRIDVFSRLLHQAMKTACYMETHE